MIYEYFSGNALTAKEEMFFFCCCFSLDTRVRHRVVGKGVLLRPRLVWRVEVSSAQANGLSKKTGSEGSGDLGTNEHT